MLDLVTNSNCIPLTGHFPTAQEAMLLREVTDGDYKISLLKTEEIFAEVFNLHDGSRICLSGDQLNTQMLSHRQRQNLENVIQNWENCHLEYHEQSHQLYFRPIDSLKGGNPVHEARLVSLIDEAGRLANAGRREEAKNKYIEAFDITTPEEYGYRGRIVNESAYLCYQFRDAQSLSRMINSVRIVYSGGLNWPKHELALPVYWLGRIFSESNQHQTAIGCFKESLARLKTQKPPDIETHANLHWWLGNSQEKMAQYSASLENYRIARALGYGSNVDSSIQRILEGDPSLKSSKPNSLPGHLNLICVVQAVIKKGWEQLGQNKEQAEHFFKVALEYAENRAAHLRNEIFYGLACVLDQQGESADAKENIDQAIQAEEANLRSSQTQRANSKIRDFYLLQAHLLWRLEKNPQDSIASVDAALQHAFRINLSDPQWYAKAYCDKGVHTARTGNFRQAALFYHIATKIDSSYGQAVRELDQIIAAHSELSDTKNQIVALREYVPYAEGSELYQRPGKVCTVL